MENPKQLHFTRGRGPKKDKVEHVAQRNLVGAFGPTRNKEISRGIDVPMGIQSLSLSPSEL